MSIVQSVLARALFLLPVLGFGQDPACNLVISGAVIDEHDRTPLAYAEVYFPALERGVVADAEGRFRINGLCAGEQRMRIMHLGCEPVERVVQLTTDLDLRIELEHHAHELAEFEVARARPDENVGLSQSTLDRNSMEQASGGSFAEMLSSIPGVNILRSGPTIGKPIIHGLSGNRILTLNQGIRQEDQQWGTEHAPNLDAFSSDRVTVVKGAASVQYGSDAIGGVIITEPVALPTAPSVSGELRAIGNLNGRGGGMNGMVQGGVKGLKGLGWRLQGSGRLLGDSKAPRYVLSNTGMNEQGASATVGYRIRRWNASVYYSYFQRELGILRTSHIGNLTDLQNAISSGTPWYTADFTYDVEAPRQTMWHQLVKAETGYAVSDRGRVLLTYGHQADSRQEFDIRRAGRSGIPATDLSLTTHTADASFAHWIGQRVHGKVGISGLEQENINLPGTGIRPLIPNYRKRSVGVFMLEHLPINSRLEFEAGARLEASRLDVAFYTLNDSLARPVHDFTNHALTAGANWTVKDSVRLRFSLATAYRPPHVSELYSEGLHHGAAAIELGNDQLTSERSLKATTDLEALWFNGRLRMDVTVYVDRMANYIYLRPYGYQLTIRGAFPVFQYVATNALLYGSDVSLQWKISDRFALRSHTSIVRGRDRSRNEWLFQMPSDRTETALVYSAQEIGSWRAVELSLTSQLVFYQGRVPEGLDFADAPSRYHLLGMQASGARMLGKHELRVGLRASNILNTSYRDYLDRFRYYADARGADLVLWVRYAFGKQV